MYALCTVCIIIIVITNCVLLFCSALNVPLNVGVNTNDILRTLIVMWDPPSNPEGIITTYMVIYNTIIIDTASNDTTYTITGLDPYTNYSVTVIACTDNDCGDESEAVIGTTEEEGINVILYHVLCNNITTFDISVSILISCVVLNSK